ncbi:MAG: type IV pilin-like G/H family protein [Nostoc sp. EfeVER01]|uniref:type IV pilin-like G/H family protein n=1 Tax=unclassified Nostoc TaxID=2593658 RepID=UPI002AD2C5B4|nr:MULTISPECIES: type IV pilin-like G/H family protein [unclassified Nostoc]MDZ7946967.1 type IV pilin-like G/H family protein [Nostoc sp. EfeVER01]MDZ7993355.1 type IV pilin-like G/H family protein [Nostoc sp. EspVER01]
MKTELKAKFLQHILNKKNENEGFTLIELLVVIIIIGILSAIALPSFLNQANKAKQSEAKTYVGSMNRAQQAYYLEKNEFAAGSNFAALGLGVATQTTNYKYAIGGGGTNSSIVTNQAQTVVAAAPLKTYIGGVGVVTQTGTSEATTVAILCEANAARVNTGADGTDTFSNVSTCPSNYSALK